MFTYCSNLKTINLGWNKTVGSSEHGIFRNLVKSSYSLESIDLSNLELSETNTKDLS